jgi:hypothetical protein
MNDPLEQLIADALEIAEFGFITDEGGGNPSNLDFRLHNGVEIEVKRFHTARIAEQMARAENVIAIQGEAAVRFFADLLFAARERNKPTVAGQSSGEHEMTYRKYGNSKGARQAHHRRERARRRKLREKGGQIEPFGFADTRGRDRKELRIMSVTKGARDGVPRHAIAMEARQGGDGETRLHPKDDSAGPQDIARFGNCIKLLNDAATALRTQNTPDSLKDGK